MVLDRELLRLHVEAVWGVQLPSSMDDDITIVLEGVMPSWSLYVAQLANERIRIWRPGVSSENRPALLAGYREFARAVYISEGDILEGD